MTVVQVPDGFLGSEAQGFQNKAEESKNRGNRLSPSSCGRTS